MTATAGTSSARWSTLDRAFLVALLLAFAPGIPGVGVETRPPQPESDALVLVYSLTTLAPLVALGASWKWPLAAAWIGVGGGVLAVALAALDLGGILGVPPPPGMIVVDAVFGIVAAAVAFRCWRLTRRART